MSTVPATDDYETIRWEVADGVATLTLNRPEQLNGMTNRMVRETYSALSRVADDTNVKVVVLTGAGRFFCPGADLKHYTDDGGGGRGRAADDDRLDPA